MANAPMVMLSTVRAERRAGRERDLLPSAGLEPTAHSLVSFSAADGGLMRTARPSFSAAEHLDLAVVAQAQRHLDLVGSLLALAVRFSTTRVTYDLPRLLDDRLDGQRQHRRPCLDVHAHVGGHARLDQAIGGVERGLDREYLDLLALGASPTPAPPS